MFVLMFVAAKINFQLLSSHECIFSGHFVASSMPVHYALCLMVLVIIAIGRRVPFRGGHGASGAGAGGRPNFGGPRDVDRGLARPVPSRREPFSLDDGGYSRPFMGRQYDDPYAYDDNHGVKRPFYMTVSSEMYNLMDQILVSWML